MKKIVLALAIVTLGLGCKKEVVGPTGPQGEQGPQGSKGEQGPGAKTYDFSITFAANSSLEYYILPNLNFSSGDVILGFVYYDEFQGTKYWAPLPYTSVNRVYLFNFDGDNGTFWVDLKNATTGANYPFTTSTTLGFRAVHIKSSTMALHPEVDWKDREQVEEFVKENKY